MIKTSVEIPLITADDIQDPEKLEILMNTIKQYCEELARKAKSYQMTERDGAPSTDDIEEGEDVGDGTNNKEYTKIVGSVYSKALTAE